MFRCLSSLILYWGGRRILCYILLTTVEMHSTLSRTDGEEAAFFAITLCPKIQILFVYTVKSSTYKRYAFLKLEAS